MNIQEPPELILPIIDIEMSIRLRQLLQRLGISYLPEVCSFTYGELMRDASFGKQTLQELEKILNKYDLKLKEL